MYDLREGTGIGATVGRKKASTYIAGSSAGYSRREALKNSETSITGKSGIPVRLVKTPKMAGVWVLRVYLEKGLGFLGFRVLGRWASDAKGED